MARSYWSAWTAKTVSTLSEYPSPPWSRGLTSTRCSVLADVDASLALPLQRVLHLVEVVGRVRGGDVVEGHLLQCGHRLGADHGLVVEAARRRDGRLAPPLKVLPPAAQRRPGDVHGCPVLYVARRVRCQVVQQHVGEHHGLDAFALPHPQAGAEV